MFLFFSDNVSRRCDEQGKWQKINITNCHRLKPKEAVDTGKRTQSNITITDKKVKEVFFVVWIASLYCMCLHVALSLQASSPFREIVKNRRAKGDAKAGGCWRGGGAGRERRACNDHS